jgi:hypothetical protein
VEHAVTVRNTALRLMPTHTPYFRHPRKAGEGFPFDCFQNSALWLGSPVALIHQSRDRAWVFAVTRFASGWLPAADVALVDEAFTARWRNSPLAAILDDRVVLSGDDGAAGARTRGLPQAVSAHIGTVLPLQTATRPDGPLGVLLPGRDDHGRARIVPALVERDKAAAMPLALTPGALAAVGNRMLGQPYGWGGLYENRDCSSTLRDLFIPFGIWLPRNSGAQGAWGEQLPLRGLPAGDKEQRILNGGIPFFSLVRLPGHVGLYLGGYELDGRKTPVMFHNLWGLRLSPPAGRNENNQARAVIGKAVVTSLRPGAELPAIASPASLLDRVEGLSILPRREKRAADAPEPRE